MYRNGYYYIGKRKFGSISYLYVVENVNGTISLASEVFPILPEESIKQVKPSEYISILASINKLKEEVLVLMQKENE